VDLLRGLPADEAEEFLRLLRKPIAAGNDRSRALLRETSTAPANKTEECGFWTEPQHSCWAK
jgi:hypothetical protein